MVLGGILILVLLWLGFCNHGPAAPKTPPPVSVTIAKVQVQDVPIAVTALGAAQAWQGVLINPQVAGKLLYVAPEGADVGAGALIAEIDCSPYLAALAQARAALARDTAVLAGAQQNLTRYQTLLAQNSISSQQVDDQAALVKQEQGTLGLDRAQIQSASVNVGYCRIVSPVSGRVGVRLIDPGNIVSTATTSGIVSVNQITPIAVTFTVPQGDFQRLAAASNGFRTPLATQAFSQETGASLGAGELTVADNHVDAATGTVALKARFPNDGRQLWPGQFVNVRLTLQTVPHALVIPSTAVNNGPKGAFAYVVGADDKAQMRPITVAATQDGLAIIQSGLAAGETVVTDGQMTLRPGARVAIAPPPGAASGPSGPPRRGP
jgi:multidrug efflux system membrane fusion protein